MNKTVICDLDGTLFNIDHRLHLLEAHDYDAFWQACKDDTANEWCVTLIQSLLDAGVPVVFVSGRNEVAKLETQRQLRELGFWDCKLFMRPKDNRDADVYFKRNILNTELAHTDILFAIEDRARVAEMYRQNGITVLQCDTGDF